MYLSYIMCLIFVFFCYVYFCFLVFFFKQKTAYEMRISDWSSDVCSSDLSVDLAPNRSWIIFYLNPKAKWPNAQPITADDVIFSFEIGRASCRERVCQYV